MQTKCIFYFILWSRNHQKMGRAQIKRGKFSLFYCRYLLKTEQNVGKNGLPTCFLQVTYMGNLLIINADVGNVGMQVEKQLLVGIKNCSPTHVGEQPQHKHKIKHDKTTMPACSDTHAVHNFPFLYVLTPRKDFRRGNIQNVFQRPLFVKYLYRISFIH